MQKLAGFVLQVTWSRYLAHPLEVVHRCAAVDPQGDFLADHGEDLAADDGLVERLKRGSLPVCFDEVLHLLVSIADVPFSAGLRAESAEDSLQQVVVIIRLSLVYHVLALSLDPRMLPQSKDGLLS